MLLSTVLKNQKTKIIEFLYRKSFQILYKNKSVNSDSDENYYLILNNDIAFENLFVIHFQNIFVFQLFPIASNDAT